MKVVAAVWLCFSRTWSTCFNSGWSATRGQTRCEEGCKPGSSNLTCRLSFILLSNNRRVWLVGLYDAVCDPYLHSQIDVSEWKSMMICMWMDPSAASAGTPLFCLDSEHFAFLNIFAIRKSCCRSWTTRYGGNNRSCHYRVGAVNSRWGLSFCRIYIYFLKPEVNENERRTARWWYQTSAERVYSEHSQSDVSVWTNGDWNSLT